MLARVITFYADSGHFEGLEDTVGAELPPLFSKIPGFCGLLVLRHPGARQHVIAMTLWDGPEGIAASEEISDRFIVMISDQVGTSVSQKSYVVQKSAGIFPGV